MRDDSDDDELEEELRLLASRLEPVPPDLIASAAGALAWRDINAELAELVFDSLLDEDAATLVRGGAERLVTFRRGESGIDVEVTATGGRRDLTGQVMPAKRAAVSIRHRQGAVSTQTDELGRFHAERVPAGPVSLRIQFADPDGARVTTDWITI